MRSEFTRLLALVKESSVLQQQAFGAGDGQDPMARMLRHAIRQHEVFLQMNTELNESLFPVLAAPGDDDVEDLLELAGEVYDHRCGVELDAGLCGKIYESLLAYSQRSGRLGLAIRCEYWLGVYFHLNKTSDADDTSINHYAAAARRLPMVESFAKQEDRAYILRCVCNTTQVLGDRDMYLEELDYYNEVVGRMEALREIPGVLPAGFWATAFMVLNLNTALAITEGVRSGRLPKRETLKVYTMVGEVHQSLLPMRENPGYVMRYHSLLLQADDLLGRATRLQLINRLYGQIGQCHRGECEDEPDTTLMELLELALGWLSEPVEGMAEAVQTEQMQSSAKELFALLKKSNRMGLPGRALPALIKYIRVCRKIYEPQHLLAEIIEVTALIHPPTCVHSVMVMHLCECLARALLKAEPAFFDSLPAAFRQSEEALLRFIRLCALSHDIGKVALPDIVGQMGRCLTDFEIGFVQRHTVIGYELLYTSAATRPFAYTALLHHRHYNGAGGYPQMDLADAEAAAYLPVAQLIMVADCLDAGTDFTGRSYAEPKTLGTVAQELKKAAGGMVNPVIAGLLCDAAVLGEVERVVSEERPKIYEAVYANKEIVLDEKTVRLSYRPVEAPR